jgi:ribose transport system permease protein
VSAVTVAIRRSVGTRHINRAQAGAVVTFIAVIVLTVVAAVLQPAFRTSYNINDILRQAVGLGTAATGQTLVILLGGIDLSVGSVAKLSEMIAAIIMNGNPAMIVPGIGAVIGIGVAVGTVNGWLVTRLGIAPFIVTFATFGLLRGIAFLISTSPVGQAADPVVTAYDAQTGPVYTVVVAFALLFLLTWIVLARTPLGRHIYAAGADVQVARLAGIRVNFIVIGGYIACAVFAALAGLFLLARSGSGDPTLGDSYQFDSITAVVLGGTNLAGGRGGVIGTMAGVLLLSIIDNVFNLMQIDASYQQLLKGAILLVAFSLYQQRKYAGG